MELKKDLEKALIELRKSEERKFNQTVDLIINLQKYDLKKNPVNILNGYGGKGHPGKPINYKNYIA